MAQAGKRIFVTGGNTGIGFELCKQLVRDHGCHVFLGSRSVDKGTAAVKEILAAVPAAEGRLELVEVDTGSDASVAAASEAVKARCGEVPLYAIVNNAGTGLAHGVTGETVVNVNFHGPKRVCDCFIPLVDTKEGRVVNVGSGAGPMFMQSTDAEICAMLKSPAVTWEQIDGLVKKMSAKPGFLNSRDVVSGAYGFSKACLHAYTRVLAKDHPNLTVSALSPGFIQTNMTKGYGASKPPEEGTVSLIHCLFAKLEGNGYYYGSDAVRSPLHELRNPGEPPYTGE